MKRRAFIAALGSAAAWPLVARAQQSKLLRVGAVAGNPKSAPQWVAFDQRMAELGYHEGKNFVLEFIQAANIDDYARGYRELVTRKVDVLVALGPEIALKSAIAVTDTLPIVMVAIDYDPLSRNYVTSLARPSGNVTGLIFQQIELAAKRIQLIKEAFPHIPAAIMFWDEASADQWQAAQNAATTLGLPLFGSELREPPYNYERALDEAAPDHRRTLIVATSPFFFRDRARLAEFALRHRMVSMFVFREWVEAGGLMSYGPKFTGLVRRAAEYVDRIARGAKPADLPVELPTQFELVINLKTTKALGLDVPPTLLARADEVIE
jgi:putative ABC transport system substrate-binding protein